MKDVKDLQWPTGQDGNTIVAVITVLNFWRA